MVMHTVRTCRSSCGVDQKIVYRPGRSPFRTCARSKGPGRGLEPGKPRQRQGGAVLYINAVVLTLGMPYPGMGEEQFFCFRLACDIGMYTVRDRSSSFSERVYSSSDGILSFDGNHGVRTPTLSR